MPNIQNTEYTKRKKGASLKDIQDPGSFSFLRSVGENGNPYAGYGSAEGNDEKDPPVEINSTQQGVVDAVGAQKRRAIDYLIKKPEAPQSKEGEIQANHKLTKVGAVAQLADSLGSIMLGRRNEDFRNVPIAGDELAFQSMQNVYNLDAQEQQELARYKDQVLATEQANQQITNQIGEYNSGIDAQMAQLKYQFSNDNRMEKLQKEAQEAIKQDNANSTYIEMGLRLISNGQAQAGMQALKDGGMKTDTISAMVREKESNGVYDRLKAFYGRDVTPAEVNLLKRFKTLEGQVDPESDYSPSGLPMTANAKKLEGLREELGTLQYAPDELFAQPEQQGVQTGQGNGQQPVPVQGSDNSAVQAMAQNIHTFSRYQDMPQAGSVEAKDYLAYFHQKIQGERDLLRAQAFISRVKQDLVSSYNATEEQAQMVIDKLMSAPSGDGSPANTAQTTQQSAQQGAPPEMDFKDMKYSDVVQAFNAGTLTIEQVAQFSPVLARNLAPKADGLSLPNVKLPNLNLDGSPKASTTFD